MTADMNAWRCPAARMIIYYVLPFKYVIMCLCRNVRMFRGCVVRYVPRSDKFFRERNRRRYRIDDYSIAKRDEYFMNRLLDIMERDLKNAEKSARESKIVAIISITISVVSVIVSIYAVAHP